MERALARHPTMRERVFTAEERAYCDRKAQAGRVLRGAVRGPGGDHQGARRAIAASAGRTSTSAAIRAAHRRSSWRATRSAAPTCSGSRRCLITFTHEKTNAVAFAVAVARDEAGPHARSGGDARPGVAGARHPRGAPDGTSGTRRRSLGRRRHGRRLRPARGRRLRQGEQRRRRLRRGPAPRAMGRPGGRRRRRGPGRPPRARRGATRPPGRGRRRSAWCGSDLRRSIASSRGPTSRSTRIFGTGFRGIPEDEWADAIAGLNDVAGPRRRGRHPLGGERRHRRGRGRRGAGRPHRDVRRAEGRRGDPARSRAGRALSRVADIGFPSDLIVSRRVPDGARRRRRGPARTRDRHAQARDRACWSSSPARVT